MHLQVLAIDSSVAAFLKVSPCLSLRTFAKLAKSPTAETPQSEQDGGMLQSFCPSSGFASDVEPIVRHFTGSKLVTQRNPRASCCVAVFNLTRCRALLRQEGSRSAPCLQKVAGLGIPQPVQASHMQVSSANMSWRREKKTVHLIRQAVLCFALLGTTSHSHRSPTRPKVIPSIMASGSSSAKPVAFQKSWPDLAAAVLVAFHAWEKVGSFSSLHHATATPLLSQ